MKTLVLGGSGATGILVVQQLVQKGIAVKMLLRATATVSEEIRNIKNIEIITGNINDYCLEQLKAILDDCDAVVSCLGHNITFKGIYGKPHKLVRNAVRMISTALSDSKVKKKFILMSTTAYTNEIHGEKQTIGETIVFSILKVLLPPHADNVAAGNYLLKEIGESNKFEWIGVRPDSLIDEKNVSEYEIVKMKQRSPIFDSGKTSRINVAHFMANLLLNEELWDEWKFKTPVLYNKIIEIA